jgi:hypothetical protein
MLHVHGIRQQMTLGRVTLLASLMVVVTLVQATKAGAQSASGPGLAADTLGGRVGTNLGDDSRSLLHRYDMLAQWMLPWKWHWGRGYELKPFVEATAGLLHNSHESSLIGSISPAVDFTVGTTGVYLTASAGLLLIPNYRLGPENFGSSTFQVDLRTAPAGLPIM